MEKRILKKEIKQITEYVKDPLKRNHIYLELELIDTLEAWQSPKGEYLKKREGGDGVCVSRRYYFFIFIINISI